MNSRHGMYFEESKAVKYVKHLTCPYCGEKTLDWAFDEISRIECSNCEYFYDMPDDEYYKVTGFDISEDGRYEQQNSKSKLQLVKSVK